MQSDQHAILDELEDVLDHERELVLAGSFDSLQRINDQKAHLLTRLKTVNEPTRLDRMRKKADRNAKLLAAAVAGVKSVVERLAALRAGPKTFSTYSATGSKTTLDRGTRSVERRA